MHCGFTLQRRSEGAASPCKEDSGERVSDMGDGRCTCGGRGTDGFSPEAGSTSREVDSKMIIRV